MSQQFIDSLKFDRDGLIPAIAQQYDSGEVLMQAYMNAEAVAKTLETENVTYWSRSRQEFWVKGATSGHHQKLISLRVDCDRDSLLILVDQTGSACHLMRRSCYFTAFENGVERDIPDETI